MTNRAKFQNSWDPPMETSNFAPDVQCISCLESTCLDEWWMVEWVVVGDCDFYEY